MVLIDIFEAFFLGSMSWIGLIFLVVVNILFMEIKNSAKVLIVLINIFIIYQYVTQDQGLGTYAWHIITLLLASIFVIYSAVRR